MATSGGCRCKPRGWIQVCSPMQVSQSIPGHHMRDICARATNAISTPELRWYNSPIIGSCPSDPRRPARVRPLAVLVSIYQPTSLAPPRSLMASPGSSFYPSQRYAPSIARRFTPCAAL